MTELCLTGRAKRVKFCQPNHLLKTLLYDREKVEIVGFENLMGLESLIIDGKSCSGLVGHPGFRAIRAQ